MNYEDYVQRAASYRAKAEDATATSKGMANLEAKRMLMEVAADYLQMAQTLERLAAQKGRG